MGWRMYMHTSRTAEGASGKKVGAYASDGSMQQCRVCALEREAAQLTTVVRASVERGAAGLGAGSTSFCHWVSLKRMACTLSPLTSDSYARLDTICSTCLAKAAGGRNKTDVSVWAKLMALLHAQAAGQGDQEYTRLPCTSQESSGPVESLCCQESFAATSGPKL